MLWESTPVTNVNYWETDTVIFTTSEKSITHLTFEPGYTTSLPYKGNVLIDNIRPYNGTVVGIEDIRMDEKETKIYDLLGREIENWEYIPLNTLYIEGGEKKVKYSF